MLDEEVVLEGPWGRDSIPLTSLERVPNLVSSVNDYTR